MDKIIVSLLGFISIIGIYWFFFGKSAQGRSTSGRKGLKGADNSISIIVEGGYKPKNISLPQGKKTTLIFIRKDENSCLEELIIPDFKIKKYLPMHTPVSLVLSPTKPGSFNFHCGMNMFHGTITVA